MKELQSQRVLSGNDEHSYFLPGGTFVKSRLGYDIELFDEYGGFRSAIKLPDDTGEFVYPTSQYLNLLDFELREIARSYLRYILERYHASTVRIKYKFLDKEKKKTESPISKITAIILLLLSPFMSTAQDEAVAPAAPASIGGLSATSFWLLATVIIIELLVIIVLGLFVKSFLAKEKVLTAEKDGIEKKTFSFKEFWDKFNKLKPIEQETDIDLGHDYDGIRELDNRLPPWWLYGFYVSILVAAIYIWRYHIAETAPLSKQEFEIAMQKAEVQKAAYLAKTASNVDENTVVFLNEPFLKIQMISAGIVILGLIVANTGQHKKQTKHV